MFTVTQILFVISQLMFAVVCSIGIFFILNNGIFFSIKLSFHTQQNLFHRVIFECERKTLLTGRYVDPTLTEILYAL